MADIPCYKKASDKQSFFNYVTIDSEKDFEEKFLDINHSGFFRGVSDARYKTYSSSQREFITKDLNKVFPDYNDFIIKLIHEAEAINDSYLKKVLKKFGTNANHWTILSFLQHYGAPTPLIDFSTNKEKALFFAIDGATQNNASNNLENYVSVYMLKDSGDLTNLRKILSNGQESLIEINNQLGTNANLTSLGLETFNKKGTIEWRSPIYLSDNDVTFENDYRIGINSNMNIFAQEGLFVLNPSREKPLEELFNGKTFESLNVDETDQLFFEKLYCWDIHKSLIKYITDYLNNRLINESTIYPERGLARLIYERVLK